MKNTKNTEKLAFTSTESDGFVKGLIQSIVTLMKENNVHELDMRDTVFGKRGGWTKIYMKNDKLYRHEELTFANGYKDSMDLEIDGNPQGVNRWDIVALVKLALEKMDDVKVYYL